MADRIAHWLAFAPGAKLAVAANGGADEREFASLINAQAPARNRRARTPSPWSLPEA